MSDQAGPQGNTGDIINWPMLKIRYRTDEDKIAALLPPGIEPGAEPNVTITIYNFPVNGMPEYGVVTNIDANFNGIAGEFSLGYGIDQEEAIFISQERNGQPKYPCSIKYYRLMEYVFATCVHQGYTFLDFQGQSTGPVDTGEPFEHNEWWLKYARSTGVAESEGFDLDPMVVRVKTMYKTARKEVVQGLLTLNSSPWDPVADLLPVKESIENYLWWPEFLSREILVEGKLDPGAFLPHADTIGGSRWPGTNGGPRKN
jgi:acetoacetate decarboxylase